MTNDLEQLGRRAVACKRWRWMEGMAAVNIAPQGVYRTQSRVVGKAAAKQVPGNLVPDLTDPATLGCLLALVREAWGDHRIHMVWLVGGFDGWQPWNIERPILSVGLKFHTEAEALVAALEGAP